jgi:hypothetical protein
MPVTMGPVPGMTSEYNCVLVPLAAFDEIVTTVSEFTFVLLITWKGSSLAAHSPSWRPQAYGWLI